MHPHELAVDDALVARLIAGQLPELAQLPITPVRSTGTVNAVYRLGDHLCARLPRVLELAESLDREWRWLPALAPHLTLQVPAPVARGHATEDYPCAWSVYRWIEGDPYTDDAVDDEARAAEDLARFVRELRSIPVHADATATGRRPLRELDAGTREAIRSMHGLVDVGAALAAWARALDAPAWDGRAPVWLHADLLRPNVLVDRGRVHAVIDFGGIRVGGPGGRVLAPLGLPGPRGRPGFRRRL